VHILIRRPLLIALLTSGFAFSQPAIHLKTRQIETDPASAAAQASGPRPLGRGHFLIQFEQPPSADTLAELAQRGVRVLADVPENGLLISRDRRVPLGDLGVRYMAPIRPFDKISPLITQNDRAVASGYYLVEFHPDVDLNLARGLLLSRGITIQENPDLGSRHLMIHTAPVQAARVIARVAILDEVAYIFPASDELANGVPVRACEGALTTNGPSVQSIPTYGDGWDGPGLGSATLTYVFARMTAQLDPPSAQSEILRAMAEWTKIVKVTWQPGTNSFGTYTVNILWATGAHGDGFPFDVAGRILAHTFYPAPPNPEPIAGDMHFDDAESWHIGTNVDLFSVALHELGHALGLGHSDNPNDVMYPYYKVVTTLGAGDAAAALTLYAAQDATTPTNPPSPAPPPNPTAPLTLTVTVPPSTTSASAISMSGSAAGGSGTIAVTWSTGAASGAATAPASAWIITGVPLAVGANTITITATAGTSQVSRSYAVTRLAATPTPPPNPADTAPPTLAITSPGATTVSTALASILISGIASDNVGVTTVTWANNFGASGTATGTTTWSVTVPLLTGSNAITLRAFDAAGNSAWRSLVVVRY
jgi:Matrixin/Bacterial Ig domain